MTTVNREKKTSDPDVTSVNAPLGDKPNLEVRVGLFFLFAMILVIYGWSWLKSVSILHPPQKITVQFHDIAGLANNAPVNINGVRVGTVEQIDLKGKGQVLCHLKIKTEEVIVPEGSTFTIQTLGLVGAKYVEISLPEEIPGEEPPPAIDPNTVVAGQDPVRVELVINKIATNLNNMIGKVSTDETQNSFVDALKHSGETIKHINEASIKLNKNMDRMTDVTDSITATSNKFGLVADDARSVTRNANSFFQRGTSTLASVGDLTKDLKRTTTRVNTIIEDPHSVGDVKEISANLRNTADTIRATIKEFNSTIKDPDSNTRIGQILDKFNSSTANINEAMKGLSKISSDQELRSDIKEAVSNAKDAMTKLDNIFADKEFKTDVRQTLNKVEVAADDVHIAASQLHQVMGKRAPLIQLMFGKLKPVDMKKDAKKAKDAANEAKGAAKDAKDAAKDAKKEADKAKDENAAPQETAPANSEEPVLR